MEALQQFCLEESSIKTRQYHCCLKQGEEKWGCFQKDAPNPSYNPTGPEVEGAQGGAKKSEGAPLLRFSWNPQFCNSENKAVLQPRGAHGSQLDLPKLSFPPGRPSPSNLRNACKLRKLRPWYPPKCLPSSGYGWFLRQSKAINRMEAELKKCCKGGTEVLKCADSKWREVMDSYCAQELSLKTTHHPCCAETGDPRYLCFAGDAPYPKYDREITNISLARLTPRAMQALCAPHRLLSRRFSVPLLVGRLREQCCGLEETERVRCAEREVLQSFKIMDYSLLLGVHNLDAARREREAQAARGRLEGGVSVDQRKPVGQKALYSTAMESIQGEGLEGRTMETDDQMGGIPARNSKGERLLIYIGIIDILQSYSVDNSEYMRNGDFLPTRLQAQQDAVNIVCHTKTRSNPENNVGLITLAKYLALKHRQGKNHKLRIIAFVGSPVEDSEKDLVKMAKRLKKEKVNVDIINFGEEALRVSMEEQRQRQEDEARRAAVTSAAEAGIPTPTGDESDEALLQMAVRQPESSGPRLPDFSSMSEEEQIAYAMQMSLQGAGRESCTILTVASLYQLYRAQRLTAASLYQLYRAQRLTAASLYQLYRAQRLTAASLSRAQRLTAASLYQLYQAQRLTAASLSRAQRLTAASLSRAQRLTAISCSNPFQVPLLCFIGMTITSIAKAIYNNATINWHILRTKH
ncbi:UNVERIFIED_CONTAM: hypothetical protein FKN15_023179 [Acipenser sinensis]